MSASFPPSDAQRDGLWRRWLDRLPADQAKAAEENQRREDQCHRQLAAEAGAIDGMPRVAYFLTCSIADLYRVIDRSTPDPDDDPCGSDDLTPDGWRRLRVWHAAWLALETKERERENRRRRADEKRKQAALKQAATLLAGTEVGR